MIFIIFTCFVLSSIAVACGSTDETNDRTPGAAVERVSHSQAALMVTTNTETALLGLTNAGSFLAESSALAETMNELGGSSETCTTSGAVVCSTDGVCESPITECTTDEVTPEDLAEMRTELEDGIRELVTELTERIFSKDNVETSDDTSVTYLLGPEDLCSASESETLQSDGSVVVAEGELDPECVDDVTRAAIRLRVTSPSEGNVDVTVILTEQRFEPVVIELHEERLAVTADLDQLASSIEALGEDLEGLESLEGRVQFELVKNAPLDYSARYNVLDDVKVVVIDDAGNRLQVSVGASTPTLEGRIDGNAKTVSASYGVGPVRVSGPLALFADMFEGSEETLETADSGATGEALVAPEPAPEPAKVYTGMIEAVLGGLDGTFTYDGVADAFSLTNLGLGDQSTTLTHDGNTLLALDVNADSGRHFDLTVHDTASGLELTFSPTLDVSLAFGFRHIADQIEVPEALMNDTLRFFFDGQNPSIRGRDNGLEVTSGTLHLTSSAHPEHDVTVSAGMCLLGGEEEAGEVTTASADVAVEPVPVDPVPVEPVASEEEHLLSVFEVGACE
jgi:hypothetical protein